MVKAHPAVLTKLIEEYEELRALYRGEGGEGVRQRMDDVAYTLCVSTGTRDVDAAVVVARRQLA
ncbi:DUF5133 domain-containing protein [Streptomyces griseocarneus]|uniref:DUF5133 domain-containing protein n=1 Tax=Streptomyces griseocarneus TaxID=51201 RepID=UPI00167CD9AF|nr:DUF5133 domain-containing protein [Streptomyces griseocarneus]MBZ6475240.1 DUF5133 domain-containing protein [Streptomyces griseocarneus]GHG61470.1 hypothetical protein GCM10018779_29380 [Streptomyces griseocarneus]